MSDTSTQVALDKAKWLEAHGMKPTADLIRALVAERDVLAGKINEHSVADAFWKCWSENGEAGKHGYYESTWISIRAALKEAARAAQEKKPDALESFKNRKRGMDL